VPDIQMLGAWTHLSELKGDRDVAQQGSKAQALLTAVGLTCFASGYAAAQDLQHHAPGHAGGNPATEAYIAASERMHRDMTIEFTGDPDVDFARGMIPHHQGAIDMARALLEHGEDPEMRALAKAIIAAQEREIAFLRSWLEQRSRAAD
jgi:uncharacterized protein (DUF305 family)